jgi:hypothetical protein
MSSISTILKFPHSALRNVGNRALFSTAGLVLVTSSCFPSVASAATLLSDNFNAENSGIGAGNYTGFVNWNVTRGSVDLIGNGSVDFFFPDNGLYLDLDGSTSAAGKLESKNTYSFNAGDTINLDFKLAGSQRGDVNSVTVSLGSLYNEVFTLPSATPFTTITRSFIVASATSTGLIFDHAGSDNFGLFLDNVVLSSTSASTAVPEPFTIIGTLIGGTTAVRMRKKLKADKA